MDKELLRELTQSIIDQSILKNWVFYLYLFLVSILGSYIGSYFKSFGSEKAKNKAIMSDLELIKRNLEATTSVTEKIKHDIEHAIWRKKAIEQIKREKLEEYFNFICLAAAGLHTKLNNAFFYEKEHYNEDALHKAEVLQKLYFPEIITQHAEFMLSVARYTKFIADGRMDIARQMKEGIEKPIPSETHLSQYPEILELINKSKLALIQAGKEYAENINL